MSLLNESTRDVAYDIRTSDKTYQKQLEKLYDIKMTEEDEQFYEAIVKVRTERYARLLCLRRGSNNRNGR